MADASSRRRDRAIHFTASFMRELDRREVTIDVPGSPGVPPKVLKELRVWRCKSTSTADSDEEEDECAICLSGGYAEGEMLMVSCSERSC